MRTHQKAQRLFQKNEKNKQTNKKKTDKIAISTQFPQPTVMEIASMTIPCAASYEYLAQTTTALTSS